MPWVLPLAALATLSSSLRPVNAAQQPGPQSAAREEEVRFTSGDITIAATLFLPLGPGPHAGVVIAHGSDPASRRNPHYRESAIGWTRAG